MPDLSKESGGTTFKRDCAVVQLDESSLSKDRLRFWEESYPSLIPNRIAWVLTLIVSIRLSYWKTGDLLHDKTQPPRRITRLVFLRYALTTIVQSYIIVDAAAFYNLHDPFFAHPTMSIDTPFPPPEKGMPIILVLLRMLPPRLVRSASVAAHAYGLISLGGAFPTIFNVLANKLGLIPELWSAHTWPIFFGRFSAVWERGLRGFWGTWWHQTMRYLTSAPGRSLSRRLGYPEHSLVDYALRTTTAFAFSGLVHAGLVPPEPLFATKPAWKIRLYIAGFFWAQIPAIGVELLVSRFGRRFFPNAWKQWWVKILAVTWVCSWFSFTIPILAVALKELGYWRSYPFSLSVWQGLSGRGWFPWLEAR
ncbi:hypothetical protein MMC06_000065 [Schaereria dolodes]|nr:hypothetical protein [Schaereria dolodes]